MDIGEKIRNERERQRLSREEMAERIGSSADLVGKYERGVRRISVEDLAKVAKVLGRPIDFFTSEREESGVEMRLEELAHLAGLDPQKKAEIYNIPRLATKQTVVELLERLEARRYGIFRQESYEAETEVRLDGSYWRWWRRRIEVLNDEMPALRLRYVHNYAPKSFNGELVKEGCSYQRGKMKVDEVRTVGNLIFFSIVFDPPLMRGDVVDVCCEETITGACLMSREELGTLIRERMLGKDIARVSLGLSVSVPTGFLRSRITFPRGYEVTDVSPNVLISRMHLVDECDRLKKERCLSRMTIDSRWVLELGVSQPVVGAEYNIDWQPPTEKDYLKLLSGEQLKRRKNRIRLPKTRR